MSISPYTLKTSDSSVWEKVQQLRVKEQILINGVLSSNRKCL